MKLPDIKDLVREGKRVAFVRYQNGELWYRHQDGFEFPVSITDTGDGVFLVEDRALVFMRWLRKHIAFLQGSLMEGATAVVT
jgi:hypothetical protein